MSTESSQTDAQKQKLYDAASKEIDAVISDEPYVLARLATTLCVLDETFDYFFWTGFYMVDPDKTDELVVGPYRGTLGCFAFPLAPTMSVASAARQPLQVRRSSSKMSISLKDTLRVTVARNLKSLCLSFRQTVRSLRYSMSIRLRLEASARSTRKISNQS